MKKLLILLSFGFLCGCVASSSSINKTSGSQAISADSVVAKADTSQSQDLTKTSPKLNIVEDQRYEDIIVEQLKEIFDKKETVVIVDLRSPEEYAKGRIIGAVNIPYSEVSAKASGILGCKCRSLVVYSSSTEESGKAAEELVKMGYRNTRNLWGGFEAWKREGGTVEGGIKKELQ